jgi:hypothetical protein
VDREPLVTRATITAIVTACLGLLVAFGVDLTTAQTAAILGVVAVAAPILVAVLSRHKVTPSSAVIAQTTKDGDVIAGEAADSAAGSVVAVGQSVDVALSASANQPEG